MSKSEEERKGKAVRREEMGKYEGRKREKKCVKIKWMIKWMLRKKDKGERRKE